jgi:N-acetylglucosaminyldiphosphoundecaprenol N-acetyl-beta-D-mannosaminyltransferase
MKENFFSLKIDILNTCEALEVCKNALCQNSCKCLYFVNAHCFNVAMRDRYYHEVLNESDIVLNDGIGMEIGSRFARVHFKENMNGTDFIPKLLDYAISQLTGIYLLGSRDGVARKAAMVLNSKAHYNFVVGYHDGFFDKQEEKEIINSIDKSGANILLVGMGVPIQEKWISEHVPQLSQVKLAIAGGAILDFISGEIKRAPLWMRCSGCEWVYRLINEPLRLFKRYVYGNFSFFYNIFKCLISKEVYHKDVSKSVELQQIPAEREDVRV